MCQSEWRTGRNDARQSDSNYSVPGLMCKTQAPKTLTRTHIASNDSFYWNSRITQHMPQCGIRSFLSWNGSRVAKTTQARLPGNVLIVGFFATECLRRIQYTYRISRRNESHRDLHLPIRQEGHGHGSGRHCCRHHREVGKFCSGPCLELLASTSICLNCTTTCNDASISMSAVIRGLYVIVPTVPIVVARHTSLAPRDCFIRSSHAFRSQILQCRIGSSSIAFAFWCFTAGVHCTCSRCR